MEFLRIHHHHHPMNPNLAHCFRSLTRRRFCIQLPIRRRYGTVTAKASVAAEEMKGRWLDSLTLVTGDGQNGGVSEQWVIGIDPDVNGAVAVFKPDCSPQVFDTPNLKVLVGERMRKRLDTKSMVQLLRSFDAPLGTTAYIEQSLPCPQDGKQGWWSGGFNYGLWIGALVASEFSVVPVLSRRWKNEFNLLGNGSNKDHSREVACTLFPSVSSYLSRKKDHGRAEALLIAAYGKVLKMRSDDLSISIGAPSIKPDDIEEIVS